MLRMLARPTGLRAARPTIVRAAVPLASPARLCGTRGLAGAHHPLSIYHFT